jgi:hypothetical protein
MHIVPDDRVESLRDALEKASRAPVSADARDYLTSKCEATGIAGQILAMNGME